MAVHNVFILLIYFVIHFSHQRTDAKPVIDIDAQSYAFLRTKGYIDTSTMSEGASQLQSQQGIIDALKRFQSYAGIPETGKLDDRTKEFMKKPRCGMPDMTEGKVRKRVRRYNHQGTTWEDPNLTWALENSNNDGITDYQVRHVLTNAFAKWSRVTNIHFTELYKKPENSAQIRVRFERWRHADPFPFDGHGGTLAHAFYPLNNKGLAGDVHFDDDEIYTLKTIAGKKERKLLWVAVHEIGHSIGLEHSPTTGAIMWPYYQNFDTDDFELTYDDIIGIQKLYGGKPFTYKPLTKGPTRQAITDRPVTRVPVTRVPVTGAPVTRAPVTKAPPPLPPKDICTDEMKTAFMGVNNQLYFVNNDHLYMLYNQNREGIEKGPVTINSHFRGLGEDNKINAVFKDPYYRVHFVFHGDTFSVFNCWRDYCRIRRDGRPRKIEYGFQNIKIKLVDIDAAFIWPADTNYLYIFKGEQYWRLRRHNFATYIAEYGYPKNIKAKWHGLPNSIDTVFKWTNNKIYFTKGKYYYRWDDRRDAVHSGYPIQLTRSFLNCVSK